MPIIIDVIPAGKSIPLTDDGRKHVVLVRRPA